MTAVPPNADSLVRFPQRDVRSDFVDATGDFVARNAGIFETRPMSFLNHSIAVTNPAGLNLDANLSTPRFRDRTIDQFEVPARFADLDGFHRKTFRQCFEVLDLEVLGFKVARCAGGARELR